MSDGPSTRRGAVLEATEERLADDIALAASLGLQQVRLDVPWAAVVPRPGAWDGDVAERLLGACHAARSAGMEPWLRLLQPTVPTWFENEGGFTERRTAATWWPRWVQAVAEHFGDVVAGWVPFEAPFTMCNRLVHDDPRRHGELVQHVVVAWRDAWRILRGVHPVATSLDVAVERAAADDPVARADARRRDHLRWGLWAGGFTDGVVRIPGRADRPLDDLQGAYDVLGLALRRDVATCVHRAAEALPDRPIAVTYRPSGDSDAERALDIQRMWGEVREAARQVHVTDVSIVPFVDRPGAPGVVTTDREPKDSAHTFATA